MVDSRGFHTQQGPVRWYMDLEKDCFDLKKQRKALNDLIARSTVTERMMEALKGYYEQQFGESINKHEIYKNK